MSCRHLVPAQVSLERCRIAVSASWFTPNIEFLRVIVLPANPLKALVLRYGRNFNRPPDGLRACRKTGKHYRRMHKILCEVNCVLFGIAGLAKPTSVRARTSLWTICTFSGFIPMSASVSNTMGENPNINLLSDSGLPSQLIPQSSLSRSNCGINW